MTEQSFFQIAQYDPGRRTGIATFINAPLSEDLENVEVGIIGIPFDGGVMGTPGARHGPREIRIQSLRRSVGAAYNIVLKVCPFEKHKIYDCGDVVLNPVSLAQASDQITNAVTTLLDKDILPICVGGDHFVTYPILKAISQKHGPVGVVQFDSHTDTSDEFLGDKYNNATPFRRAIEEGFVAPDKLVQVGIRRFYKGELDYHTEHGIRVIPMLELKQMGVEGFRQELQILKGSKVYVTFDIDFVDPAFAPGTGGPEPGGVTSFEALQLVRCLQGLNIIGMDLAEVCPSLDIGNNITSLLAAHLLYEMVCILP